MAAELPRYHFRTRDNGAAVFRIVGDARARRIEMEQIAIVNIRNGEIRPQGERDLSEADAVAIRHWMTERRSVLEARALDDIRRTVDHLNQVAHWANSKATDDALDAVTDTLLLAMHDLRQVLVRRRAERQERGPAG